MSAWSPLNFQVCSAGALLCLSWGSWDQCPVSVQQPARAHGPELWRNTRDTRYSWQILRDTRDNMLPSEEEDFLDTRLVTQLNGGYHRNGLGNGHHSNSDSNVTGVGQVSGTRDLAGDHWYQLSKSKLACLGPLEGRLFDHIYPWGHASDWNIAPRSGLMAWHSHAHPVHILQF